jgi:(p)ppGpp synthase/HD superfamily hydrolase
METEKNINVDYSEIDKKVEDIIEKTNKFLKNTPKREIRKQIKKAYEYAKEAHHGQFRLS